MFNTFFFKPRKNRQGEMREIPALLLKTNARG